MGAAALLNERQIPTRRGGRWWGESLMRMGQRLGLYHPLASPHRSVPYKHRHYYWGMDLRVPLFRADESWTVAGRAAATRVRRACANGCGCVQNNLARRKESKVF